MIVRLTDGYTPCAEVYSFAFLEDNYGYVVVSKDDKIAFGIDLLDATTALNMLKAMKVTLKAMLCTHKHDDHSGGNIAIKSLVPDIIVYGSRYERTPGLDHELGDGETIKIGNLMVTPIHTPCHTRGHLSYYVFDHTGQGGDSLVFTGDCLFVSGCGKFFEGTAKDMLASFRKLKELPSSTLMFCGHEYSVANLEFSKEIDPKNDALINKLKYCKQKLSLGLPTLPTTLEEELKYNPFFRTHATDIQKIFSTSDEEYILKQLRESKDRYKRK